MADRRRFLKTIVSSGGALAASSGAFTAASNAEPTGLTSEAATGNPGAGNGLRLALMQAAVPGADQQKNFVIAEEACRRAAVQDADLLLMPEMWNIGYRGFSPYDETTTRQWAKQAIDRDGPWVGRFRQLAKELSMAIAVTYLERWQGGPRNTVSLIDRHGDLVLNYSKVHTCDFAFEAACTPGEGWDAVDLDTAVGPVRTGAMICFDREFPESARCLMLAGAELVITPNACRLDDLRIAQLRVRGFENAMAMALANYAAPPLLNGRSIVTDATGETLVEAGSEPDLLYTDIDLNAMRTYRKHTLWGNAWRNPAAYGALTRKVHLDVFRRNDAYGHPFGEASSIHPTSAKESEPAPE